MSIRRLHNHLFCKPPHLELWLSPCGSRSFSLSLIRFSDKDGSSSVDGTGTNEPAGGAAYVNWLKKTGLFFRDHDKPRNWLGGNRPFPLNPTFKPPTPVSDQLRSLIYAQFMTNPATNDVRTLSERYGLSLKRVDAILRLKGLEESWAKEKLLQTGFLKGMERILGVTEDKRQRPGVTQGADLLGEDATQSDHQGEVEGNDVARHRYQRMFWEPVLEGMQPVVPARLELARAHAAKFTKAAEGAKPSFSLLGRSGGVPPEGSVQVVERTGRPAFKFVDVGGKFLDASDRLRRVKESERRSKLREKRRLQKSTLIAKAKSTN